MAYGDWHTNSALIADVAKLGYIHGAVLDMTYGLGNFWNDYKPKSLVMNDLNQDKGATHVDYRNPAPDFWRYQFDTVVFDPPYKLNGTPTDDDRYGVDEQETTQGRMSNIFCGLEFARQCLADGGYLLVKCQDQVVSGKVYWQTMEIIKFVNEGGNDLIDRFDMTYVPRPQPAGRRQVHARRNGSTLLVFK